MPNDDVVLINELQRFRGKLLDLSLRNPLLNYRKSSRKTLQIVDELPDEVYRRLVELTKPMKLVADLALDAKEKRQASLNVADELSGKLEQLELLPKSSYVVTLPKSVDGKNEKRHSDDCLQTNLSSQKLQSLMRTIARDAKATIDETGINYLHLAIGFLKWKETSIGDAEGRLAPLILIPINVETKPTFSGTNEYYLKWNEDEIQSNASLRRKLESDFGLSLPEMNEEESPEVYMRRIETVAAQHGWIIERQMLLGFFSFHKLSMYADIAPENWEASGALGDNSLASRLIVGGSAGGGDGIYATDYDVDEHPIARTLDLPLDADSSQQSAISDIADGKSLVIEGPPGTGKSQTIANAIANAMHQGKTVLFVAEKHAALEVVLKRLSNAGLGDFCLDLHGQAVAPKKVMESLAKRLSRSISHQPGEVDPKKRLAACKQNLSNYLKDTAKIVGPYREPLYDLFWRVVRIRQSGGQVLRDIECDIDLDLDGFEQATASLKSFEKSLKDFQDPKDSAWWGFFPTELAPNESNRILDVLRKLGEFALRLEVNVQQTSELLGCSNGTACDFLSKLSVTDLIRLGSTKLNFGVIGLDQIVNPKSQQFGIDLQRAHTDFTETKTSLAKTLLVDVSDATASLSLMDADAWKRLEDFPKSLQVWQLQEVRIWAETTLGIAFKLVEWAKSMNVLGFVDVDRFDDFERAIQQIHLVQHPINVDQTSLPQSLHYDSAKTILGSAKAKWDTLTKRKQEIATVFHLASVPDSDNLVAILKKFRASSNGFFRAFKSDYRQSLAEIKQFADFPKKYSSKQILSALESLERFERDKKEFESDESLKRLLVNFFKGLDSDWDKIKTLMAWVQTARKLGLDPIRINTLLPQRDEICLKFSVKEMNLELANIKAQLSSEHSKSAGLDSLEGGACRINNLVSRLMQLISHLRQIDSTSRVLSDGRNATLADIKFVAEQIDLHRASLKSIEKAAISTDADEHAILNAIQSKQVNFKELVAWVTDFKKLNLGIHAFDNLTKFGPNIFCETLATTCIETQNIVSEWNTHRELIVGKAEVNRNWLSPMENGVLRSDITSMVQKLEAEKERLPAWISVCRSYSRCRRLGVSAFAMAGIENQSPGIGFAEMYQMTFLQKIADRELHSSQIGFGFTAAEMEDTRRSFQSIDRACMSAVPDEIVRKVTQRRPPEGNGRGRVVEFTELALIKHEIAKKTRHCRIRDLMSRAGTAVQAIKPCFLMSPLSLSRYIPSDQVKFDLVIMDEASQIKPEDAIGAILRAKQLVVVGDPKQLPPTSFFDRTDEDLEDDEATQFDNAESVLEVAMKSFQPYRRLRWHYRSQHESLIHFSNHRFYDSDLIVFPSAKGISSGYGVKHHYVSDATCLKGANVQEAEAVVRRVVEHARTTPTESLGVAAFNQRQAELIQDLLDKACDQDRRVAEAVDALRNLDDELFVKNLESIQGDERDVMFISYTYGPDPTTGRVFQRFGPINSEMGWRRLNVMVTRSRKRMEIFSSLKPSDIHTGPDKSRGINSYREFLEYAATGRMIEAGTESGREPGSPFEESVAQVVSSFGLEPVFQIGVAGYFIDIGVRKPGEQGNFILGIECDGATYHSSRSARDRDRLREEVILQRGWTLHRIWSTEWFLNQRQEEVRLQRILEAILKQPS